MAGIIPISPTPNQTFSVVLGGENIRIALYQRRTGVFMDVSKNDIRVVSGAICRTGTFIVRAPYLGLPGDFAFIDMQAMDDPDYTGFGSRFLLYYSGE